MKRPYIPFFLFLVLLVLTIPLSFDFATSVVPGWHTTVYPPSYILGLVLLVVLLLVTIGYWLLARRSEKINSTIFWIHLVLTLPTVIYLRLPSIFWDIEHSNQEELIESLSIRVQLILVAWTLFSIGQLFFIIYFIKNFNSKRVAV